MLSSMQTLLTDTILLGGRSDAESLDSLKRVGITHILNVALQCSNCFPQSFVYMKIPMLGDFMSRVALHKTIAILI